MAGAEDWSDDDIKIVGDDKVRIYKTKTLTKSGSTGQRRRPYMNDKEVLTFLSRILFLGGSLYGFTNIGYKLVYNL